MGAAAEGDFAYDFGDGTGASGEGVMKIAADIKATYTASELEKQIAEVRRKMEAAAKELDFASAARWRNLMYALQGRDGAGGAPKSPKSR